MWRSGNWALASGRRDYTLHRKKVHVEQQHRRRKVDRFGLLRKYMRKATGKMCEQTAFLMYQSRRRQATQLEETREKSSIYRHRGRMLSYKAENAGKEPVIFAACLNDARSSSKSRQFSASSEHSAVHIFWADSFLASQLFGPNLEQLTCSYPDSRAANEGSAPKQAFLQDG